MPDVLERETAIARDGHRTTPDRHPPMPVVVTVPSRDLAFRVHVEAAMSGDGRAAPDALEVVLRRAYPRAVVHAGNAFGTILPEVRWYIYRDPDETEASETPALWWDDPSLSRTVIDAAGRYIEANESAADLFGVSRERILGAAAGAFTKHEGSDVVRDRLLETLHKSGELCSTAVIVKPDGSEHEVDFHISRSTNGECTTVMRPRLRSGR